MPFNGAGVFTRIYSWVVDAANNVNVDATRTDTDSNDIASGLSMCVTKDGQQTLTANLPMAGFKLTGMGVGASSGDSATFGQLLTYSPHVCEGRLTLSTGIPVPTTDVTGATTVYFTPYKGNKIALYDGSNWLTSVFSEISIAIPAGASKVYDIFCYSNAGTPTLEALIWTSDTARATALTTQDGVLVKTGAVTRRYLGTIRSDVSGNGKDSFTNRWVWNYYNRVQRPMRATDATANWGYSTNTFRQANGSASNQLDFVVGWSEDLVNARVLSQCAGTAAMISYVAVGLDSTTTPATGCAFNDNTNATGGPTSAYVSGYPGVGRHTYVWLEKSSTAGTTTWEGTDTTAVSSISGEIWS